MDNAEVMTPDKKRPPRHHFRYIFLNHRYQEEFNKNETIWENRVRIESAENPLIWNDYVKWAKGSCLNTFQLKQLEQKALNAILSTEDR